MQGATRNNVLGYVRRENPELFSTWKRAEYECLPAIGSLIAQGQIQPFSYLELWYEESKRKAFPRTEIGRLFEIPAANHVESPIERHYFFSSDMLIHISRKRMVEFCTWLKNAEADEMVAMLRKFSSLLTSRGHPDLPEHMFGAAADLGRYHELCRGLSNEQCLDAYHLWAAERASVDRFITMDKKFINAMTESKRISLPCPPVAPSQILAELGVRDKAPFPFAPGHFYSLWGRPMEPL